MENLFPSCPLTGLPTDLLVVSKELYEYKVQLNGITKRIQLSQPVIEIWKKIVPSNYKNLFYYLLYNNQWPFEEETILTPDLLGSAFSTHGFPKLEDVDQGSENLLMKVFELGGEHLNEVELKEQDIAYAFQTDPKKLNKFLEILANRGFISFEVKRSKGMKISFLVSLIGRGFEHAKKIQKRYQYKRLPPLKSPNLIFIYSVFNKKNIEKVEDFFLGGEIKSITRISYDQNSHDIASLESKIKPLINASNSQFLLFLSSSDVNAPWFFQVYASLRSQLGNLFSKKMGLVFFDDAKLPKEIGVDAQLHEIVDWRIIPARYSFHNRIITSFNTSVLSAKNDETINLPKIELTQDERLWLEQVYFSFLNGRKHDPKDLYIELNGKISSDFDDAKISRYLIHSDKITPLGIYQISPDNILLIHFEKMIKKIKSGIERKEIQDLVSSEYLKIHLPEIKEVEFPLLLSLLTTLPGFTNGSSFTEGNQVIL